MADHIRRQVCLASIKVNKSIFGLTNYYSKVYVDKITSHIPGAHKRLSSPVVSVSSTEDSSKSIELRTTDGAVETFDHVILACHSDTALRILKRGNCTEQEVRILSKFGWNKNEAVLHSDPAVSGIFDLDFPRSRLNDSCLSLCPAAG